MTIRWRELGAYLKESGSTIAAEMIDGVRTYYIPRSGVPVHKRTVEKLIFEGLIKPVRPCIDPDNPQEWEAA